MKITGSKNIAVSSASFNKRLKGQTPDRIYRSDKEMSFAFSDGSLLGLHLMLTGDIFVFDKKNDRRDTLEEMHFQDGSGTALMDRMRNAFIKLDPEDKAGVDALSPELNYNCLKTALQRKAKIKTILTDQNPIRGIGNSYSDEILW